MLLGFDSPCGDWGSPLSLEINDIPTQGALDHSSGREAKWGPQEARREPVRLDRRRGLRRISRLSTKSSRAEGRSRTERPMLMQGRSPLAIWVSMVRRLIPSRAAASLRVRRLFSLITPQHDAWRGVEASCTGSEIVQEHSRISLVIRQLHGIIFFSLIDRSLMIRSPRCTEPQFGDVPVNPLVCCHCIGTFWL